MFHVPSWPNTRRRQFHVFELPRNHILHRTVKSNKFVEPFPTQDYCFCFDSMDALVHGTMEIKVASMMSNNDFFGDLSYVERWVIHISCEGREQRVMHFTFTLMVYLPLSLNTARRKQLRSVPL